MRNSETPELCVGGFRVCLGLESYPGTEGAGLALLAGLALRGRLLGAHMSQWHHPGSGWGRGRDFPGHSPAKKSGNHVPERTFSQNPNVYWRGHMAPPGPPGEVYSHRKYTWNVKPNASRAAQERKRAAIGHAVLCRSTCSRIQCFLTERFHGIQMFTRGAISLLLVPLEKVIHTGGTLGM
ncbi:RNA/RNP complex-1-interacting phosphatase isoform X1 [Sapajus apella]|uniref:RNA/RNP complex-1-interacting phosphatase isoform X1 n=1 Tax=Sapajus apella TaxID=9515 RepID=A0A6J3HDG1_SAPAP|nr:RNA/RNP complex-1-interacting phosphatase isoform X1 [Sapajus apella]